MVHQKKAGRPVPLARYGPLVKWPKTPASHAGNSGSNPLRVTRVYNGATCLYKSHFCGLNSYKSVFADLVGVYYDEGPPVPIPNTVVKLIRAENTWLEAARENRSMPT